jgi:hypothetical protein
VIDERVPGLAGAGGEHNRVAMHLGCNAAQCNAKDEGVKAAIRDEQVRASAEHEDRDAASARPGERLEDRRLARGLGEIARRAADAERCVGREIDVIAERERQGFTLTRVPAMKLSSMARTFSTKPW